MLLMQTARALGSWGSTSWPSKSRDAYAKGLLARVQSLLPGRGGLWECLDIKPHKGCPQSLREGYRTPGLLHPQPPREGPPLLGAWENPQAWVPEPPGRQPRTAWDGQEGSGTLGTLLSCWIPRCLDMVLGPSPSPVCVLLPHDSQIPMSSLLSGCQAKTSNSQLDISSQTLEHHCKVIDIKTQSSRFGLVICSTKP